MTTFPKICALCCYLDLTDSLPTNSSQYCKLCNKKKYENYLVKYMCTSDICQECAIDFKLCIKCGNNPNDKSLDLYIVELSDLINNNNIDIINDILVDLKKGIRFFDQ